MGSLAKEEVAAVRLGTKRGQARTWYHGSDPGRKRRLG